MLLDWSLPLLHIYIYLIHNSTIAITIVVSRYGAHEISQSFTQHVRYTGENFPWQIFECFRKPLYVYRVTVTIYRLHHFLQRNLITICYVEFLEETHNWTILERRCHYSYLFFAGKLISGKFAHGSLSLP